MAFTPPQLGSGRTGKPNPTRHELKVSGTVKHEVVITGAANDPSQDARHAAILEKLDALRIQGEQIMGNIQLAREALASLNATTNTISQAVTDVIAADQAEDDAFRAEIQALKDQVAAGEAVTAEQLEELTAGMGGTKATLEAVAAALAAMGSNPSEPLPPVDIPPVEPPTE